MDLNVVSLRILIMLSLSNFIVEKSLFSAETLERIEVVGTRLKPTWPQAMNRIEIINRNKIEQSGTTSIADLVREHSITASFGGYRSEVNKGNPPAVGPNSLNLRGLGEQNTLVLLDGKRMPKNSITGAVDVNTIPIALVERIEILKDGGPAIYGSEALGGVVNIVTRKNIDDWNLSTIYERPETGDGSIMTSSVSFGRSDSSFKHITSFSSRTIEPVYLRDRDWTTPALSTYAIPGNYKNPSSESWYDYSGSPDLCPTNLLNGECSYDYSASAQYYPEIREYTLYNSLEYNLPDRPVTVFSRFLMSKNYEEHERAPNAGLFRIPSDVADSLDPPNHNLGEDILVKYRAVGLGNRRSETVVHAYDALLGMKGTIASTTDWDVSVANGQYELHTDLFGYAEIDKINALIAGGNFNPLTAENPEDIRPAAYLPWEKTKTLVTRIDANLSTELGTLQNRAVLFSTGISLSSEQYQSDADYLSRITDPATKEGKVLGNQSSQGEGERSIIASHAELFLPLGRSLDGRVAMRYDKYGDFGSAVSPQLTIQWQPSDSLLLTGQGGSGFRAPSLRQLFQSDTTTFPYFLDRKRCNQSGESCQSVQQEVIRSGNEKLSEETSSYFNLGGVFQPSAYFYAAMHLWDKKITNAIPNEWDLNQIMNADALNELPDGIIIERQNNDPIGEIVRVIAPIQNVTKKSIRGYDLKINFTKKFLSAHLVGLDMAYSRILYFKEQPLPGLPEIDRINSNGHPPWRALLNFKYGISSFSFNLQNLRISKHRKLFSDGYVGSYSKWGAQFNWRYSSKAQMILGSSNVFDRKPPLDDSQRGENQLSNSLYSAIARTYYFGISLNM